MCTRLTFKYRVGKGIVAKADEHRRFRRCIAMLTEQQVRYI